MVSGLTFTAACENKVLAEKIQRSFSIGVDNMKQILFALSFLFLSGAAHASLCHTNGDALKSAQVQLEFIEGGVQAGTATFYEFLDAQKTVLQIQICQRENDFLSFSQLIKNALDRYEIAQEMLGIGMGATSFDVAIVKGEVEGLKTSCSQFIPTLTARVNAGLNTRSDLSMVQNACSSLTAVQ